ncbi:hypothetical protein [Azospirillum doebereinerae]
MEPTSSLRSSPSPPRGDGRGEGGPPAERSSPCVPLTLTLSPGGRGDWRRSGGVGRWIR